VFGTVQSMRPPVAGNPMKPDSPDLPNPWATPINRNNPDEVRVWCRVFGCGETELRSAIAKVGTSSDKVLAELLRKRAPLHLVG